MQSSVRKMDETGNATSQVQQGVYLHCSLGGAEVRPQVRVLTRLQSIANQVLSRIGTSVDRTALVRRYRLRSLQQS